VPNNSVLVVTGDVEAQTVFDQVDKLYTDWKKAADPFKKFPLVKHPPIKKSEVVLVEQKVQTVNAQMVWHGPSTVGKNVADTYAADAFFTALALLVAEWLDDETPLSLPTTTDPLVAAAIEYTDQHLADVALRDVCSAVGASERSLRRAFVNATGMSWRQYLQESRLLKAMALLAEGDQSTLTIAMSVGFESASAFTRAFHRYAGETPKSYRRRTRALPPPDEWDEEEALRAIQKLSRVDEPESAG